MNLFGKKLLREFIEKHTDARSAIDSWEAEVEDANWNTSHELKARYRRVNIIKGQVIFDICDNRYRLWVFVNYKNKMVLVKKVGTHKEYDKWNIC